MQVVILCGGQGTRLREETEYRPKPLVEIGGYPILWHIMKRYAHFGYQKFILCLGYRGEMIKEYFLNYEAMNNDFSMSLGKRHSIEFLGEHQEQDYRVTLLSTGLNSMTGSRVKQTAQHIHEDLFMVTYGDGVSDIDIQKLVAFHKSHGKLATISSVKPTSRFGVLDIDSDGKVNRFLEKPQVEGWISMGYFVFDRRVFDYIQADESCVLEQEPLEKLARDGQLVSYQHPGAFYAMDTYREYLQLNKMWRENKAPWKVNQP